MPIAFAIIAIVFFISNEELREVIEDRPKMEGSKWPLG